MIERGLGVSLLGLLSLVATEATAESQVELSPEVRCGAESASGRHVCRVTLRPPSKERLVWADVLVAQAPEFVRPLRARVPATIDPKGEQAEAVFALVASRKAEPAPLRLSVRAVVCVEERCRPLEASVETLVSPT